MTIIPRIESRRDNRIIVTLLIVLLSSSFYGCELQQVINNSYRGLTQRVKGKYYLDNKKYKDGMKAFKKEAKTNPESAEAQYYMGRFQLAENQNKKAMDHLKRAVMISPGKADFQFWLGVAYAANGKTNAERKCYFRAIDIDNKHDQALTYLGHNQFEKGEYKNALKTYDRALELWPENPSALYNRALVLKRLKRTPEERLGWKQYLRTHPSGAKARQAVLNLNALGDFEYRNQLIGKRMVPLKKIEFEPSTPLIKKTSAPALDFLGTLLKNDPSVALHIVTYQKNNKTLAEARGRSVKKYLIKNFAEIDSSRVRASWFDVSEKIKIGKKTFREEEAIKFITKKSAPDRKSPGLTTLKKVALAEKRAAASARSPDLQAKATIEFFQMAEQALQDTKKSGDAEAITTAQAAYNAAVKSVEETVAEALSVHVEAIRAMRDEGIVWGMIAHELGAHPSVLGVVPSKRGKRYPSAFYIGGGRHLKLPTEITLATKRNKKSGLFVGEGLKIADGSRI